MITFEKLALKEADYLTLEELGGKEKALIGLLKLLKGSKLALKLTFFEKLLNYLRVIAFYIIDNNHLVINFEQGISPGKESKVNTLAELLHHLGIVEIDRGFYVIKPGYLAFGVAEKVAIRSAVLHESPVGMLLRNPIFQHIIEDFLFVRKLVRKFRNASFPLDIPQKKAWVKLLEKGHLDYEVRLSETLFELTKLQIPNKIPSVFDESYYTESGRNAFKNFTQHRFKKVLDTIGKKEMEVLDVGCGYGNYIDVLKRWSGEVKVKGVELQKEVFEEVSARFTNDSSVQVFNENIFTFGKEETYDLVLLNYVLFYFSKKEKVKLFERLKSLLKPGGSILICQYYSGIEGLKKELAAQQGELNSIKKIEMYFSNKVLYANSLWNESASTFSQAERWEEFQEILSQNGLKINALTHADKFYYSLFIEVIAV
ncbi:class I SAM-dependent methyltransferase [Flammeovirgaceae bacterium SG7u.111]|nr:class I SAM-dependent methyltransferase [Flammeovirgaceae bacterium SG7u.132]WPO36569.1 class I SAM-dependent methyltransferase [Flammeovirgaceae bacterium SG7u.111]